MNLTPHTTPFPTPPTYAPSLHASASYPTVHRHHCLSPHSQKYIFSFCTIHTSTQNIFLDNCLNQSCIPHKSVCILPTAQAYLDISNRLWLATSHAQCPCACLALPITSRWPSLNCNKAEKASIPLVLYYSRS
jgi:hypothetical protein